jgi:hypothetical protein
MLDGVTDAFELLTDLLDASHGQSLPLDAPSQLNSGSSPAPGPTGAGSAGSAGSSSPPPPRDPRDPYEPSKDPGDIAQDVAETAWDEGGETMVDEVVDQWTKRTADARRFFREVLKTTSRPRIPGNPATDLLSEEGAEFQRGAMEYLDEHANRSENLATSDFDYDAYLERRQRGPLGGERQSAVDRDGDTAANRFKDWFWGRSSDGGDAGGGGGDDG